MLSYNIRIAVTLIFSAATSAYAGTITPACAMTNFNEFVHVFSNKLLVQKQFTRIPLIRHGKQIPGPVFPVLPLEDERDQKGLALNAQQTHGRSGQVTLFNDISGFQETFHFQLTRGCWYLTRIEDRSLIIDGKVVENWLERVFPSISSCTPAAFYYDTTRRRSNNGLLEMLGYNAYLVDAETARYRVKEQFHGIAVSEVWISSSSSSFVSLTLDAAPRNVSKAIAKSVGETPALKQVDGGAYVVPHGARKSYFVCESIDY